MIKKLRFKFIATAMLVITVVLFAIICIINVRNYSEIINKADATLDYLANHGGRFTTNNDFLSPETPFQTRFFTVYLDSDGKPLAVFIDSIAAIDANTAQEYATDLYNSAKTSGFENGYRFLSSYSERGFLMYIFLDISHDISIQHEFLTASLLISFIGLIIVFILVTIFSKLVFKPVAETYEKQKRFITDANHELKTPLTVINASCEVLEITQGENEWLNTIKQEINKLTDLTNNLVFLSRMDEENKKTVMSDFSLSETAEELTERYVAIAKTQNKSFTCNIAKNLSCCGDLFMVKQLLTVLLDNAFKYSDECGYVNLSVSESSKQFLSVRVVNSVEVTPPCRPDMLFERFFRPDNSRNSKSGGHGIGLSIAKAIVEAHSGKIVAEYPDSHTVTFTAYLPKAANK